MKGDAEKVGYLTPRYEGMRGMWPGFDDSELRWLREWHATKYKQARALEQKHRAVADNPNNVFRHTARSKAQDYKHKMTVHLRAVQALNDCFEINDNVEL